MVNHRSTDYCRGVTDWGMVNHDLKFLLRFGHETVTLNSYGAEYAYTIVVHTSNSDIPNRRIQVLCYAAIPFVFKGC